MLTGAWGPLALSIVVLALPTHTSFATQIQDSLIPGNLLSPLICTYSAWHIHMCMYVLVSGRTAWPRLVMLEMDCWHRNSVTGQQEMAHLSGRCCHDTPFLELIHTLSSPPTLPPHTHHPPSWLHSSSSFHCIPIQLHPAQALPQPAFGHTVIVECATCTFQWHRIASLTFEERVLSWKVYLLTPTPQHQGLVKCPL